MKNSLLVLFSLLFLLTACREDDEIPITNVATFNYDGSNNTAPILDAGEHIAAARFTANQTSPFNGRTLDRIEFFLFNVPAVVEVRVYGAGTSSAPGDLLYSADLSNDLISNSWIGHALVDPVPITGEDLWIAVRVVHNFQTQSIGCDFGPATNNGDFILTDPGTSWRTFRDVTNNQADINWNIRGFSD